MGRLPDWCEPLLDAPRMRAVDSWAIEERGVPSLNLMERAGEGVAAAVQQLTGMGPIAVVCGKGNNGGDGLVVARLLRESSREVTVVCLAPGVELSPDARTNLERLPGEPPLDLDEQDAHQAIAEAGTIVDGLLGTGFEGQPRGRVAEAIAAMNASDGQVLSIDVPSGVDASTGVVSGLAINADLTVTFHASKPGLWISPGKSHAGTVRKIDIGVPRGAPMSAQIGLLEPHVLDALPKRAASSTKFTSGHVVVVGGSAGLMGAPAMASLAAMRAGAGYVTACVPKSMRSIIDMQLMEVMSRGLPDEGGTLTPQSLPEALEALGHAGALALGPGLGRDPRTAELTREMARRSQIATVLDADGLNAHAGVLTDLALREAPTVLTPHVGELARLLDIDSDSVERERLAHACSAAEQAQAVVVLKGDDTLIADPGGLVIVSRGASPALATAGTGDVLTGTVAALLAQGIDAFTAAAAAVEMHAQAGREAARRQGGVEGVIAGDVIAALPASRLASRS